MSEQREPILGVDLLRLLAAFLVTGYHLGFRAWSDPTHTLNRLLEVTPQLYDWSGFSWFGWIGVQVFFVISGFVIAFSSDGSSVVKFIRSRVLRLMPALWISIVICAAAAIIWGVPAGRVVLLSLKTALLAPIGPWIAGQVWTLAIEVMFYCAVLLLLWRDSFNRIEGLAAFIAFASAIYWSVMLFGFSDPAGRITELLLLKHGCYFALGIVMWLFHRSGWSMRRGLLAVLCIATAWPQIGSALASEAPRYGFVEGNEIVFAIWLAFIGMLALSIYYNDKLLRLFGAYAPLVRIAGIMTYPLYLLHYHVGGSIMVLAHDSWSNPAVALVLAFLASIIAAYFSAVLLEPIVTGRLRASMEPVLSKIAEALPSLMVSTRRYGSSR